MFDGIPDAPLPRLVIYENRGGKHPVKIIYTSAPSLAVQLARQVRSNTGMTWGVKSADGAKMPPAFTASPQRQRAEAPQKPRLSGLTGLQTFLQETAAAGGLLPPRTEFLSLFGRRYLDGLQALKTAGCIDLWFAYAGNGCRQSGIAIRIKGSDVVMRTPDAPLNIRF